MDIHTDIRADVRIELCVLRTVRPGKDMVRNPPFTLPIYDRHPAAIANKKPSASVEMTIDHFYKIKHDFQGTRAVRELIKTHR